MSTALTELTLLKIELSEGVDQAQKELDRVKAKYNTIEHAIELLNEYRLDSTQSGIDLVREIDFTGSQNLVERLKRIADKNNGLINPTRAAEILIEAGQTRSSKANIRSIIHRTLQEHDDGWEKIGVGQFRLIGWGESEDSPQPDEELSDEERESILASLSQDEIDAVEDEDSLPYWQV